MESNLPINYDGRPKSNRIFGGGGHAGDVRPVRAKPSQPPQPNNVKLTTPVERPAGRTFTNAIPGGLRETIMAVRTSQRPPDSRPPGPGGFQSSPTK